MPTKRSENAKWKRRDRKYRKRRSLGMVVDNKSLKDVRINRRKK
jgi:hypothetical protein